MLEFILNDVHNVVIKYLPYMVEKELLFMATTKKTAKPAAKKVVKAVVKKQTKAKRSTKPVNFKICREKFPFVSFHFTEQTVYWIILLALIFALSLWVLKIQLDTTEIINSITV